MTPEGLAYRKSQLEALEATKPKDVPVPEIIYRDNSRVESLKSEREGLARELESKKSQLAALKNNE